MYGTPGIVSYYSVYCDKVTTSISEIEEIRLGVSAAGLNAVKQGNGQYRLKINKSDSVGRGITVAILDSSAKITSHYVSTT